MFTVFHVSPHSRRHLCNHTGVKSFGRLAASTSSPELDPLPLAQLPVALLPLALLPHLPVEMPLALLPLALLPLALLPLTLLQLALLPHLPVEMPLSQLPLALLPLETEATAWEVADLAVRQTAELPEPPWELAEPHRLEMGHPLVPIVS